LGRGLLESELANLRVGFVRDYSEHVGGGRFLPPPVPKSLADEERALGEFLRIESDRTAHLRASVLGLVVIDRSVHTLLAHCHALSDGAGVDYESLARRRLTESDVPVWPDLVVYLDVGIDTVRERNRGKFDADSIFINAEFNAGLRTYFHALTGHAEVPVVWLDGGLDPLSLRRLAATQIRELVRSRGNEGGAA
jgi:thymidylate kinase